MQAAVRLESHVWGTALARRDYCRGTGREARGYAMTSSVDAVAPLTALTGMPRHGKTAGQVVSELARKGLR